MKNIKNPSLQRRNSPSYIEKKENQKSSIDSVDSIKV
jgi:hypothetical protein